MDPWLPPNRYNDPILVLFTKSSVFTSGLTQYLRYSMTLYDS